jgi:bifunctional non-homologous end joining protein LigD
MTAAKTESFAEWIEPMAATLTDRRFTDPAWTFERKLDGIRMLAFKNGSDVRLRSRNQLPLEGSYPAVVDAIRALPVREAIFDGEATGAWGRQGDADYHVFDLLWLDGRDLTALPLEARRQALDAIEFQPPVARVRELHDAAPWIRACAQGWEGVVAKRRDSIYEHRRSPHWLKMKCEASQELVVGGFTDPRGARVGLGALLVGYFDRGDCCFAGKVGTGFDTPMLRDLRARLDRLEIPAPPFTKGQGLPRKGAHWVRPELVVQVAFVEWTGHGKLRHPRFLGLRDDKAAADVIRERP